MNNDKPSYELLISKLQEDQSEENINLKSHTKKEHALEANKKRKVIGIEKILWETAKKYKELLDRDEVSQLAESEEDRKTVEEAYKELSTTHHWLLDARVYQSFTKMQRVRDTKIALEGTTEFERLKMIAWEVKTRIHPVVFFAGHSSIESDIFHMHETNSVRILEGDAKEILVEDNILEEKGVAILDDLPLRKLTKMQKKELKQNIIQKYSGKTFTQQELNAICDSIDADLISLMTREGEIILLKIESQKYQLLTIDNMQPLSERSTLQSQSLTIKPERSVKE